MSSDRPARRIRSGHAMLTAHGEPWVWLTAASLAIAIAMIVGLLAFLLGVVVAYQGADQLRHYGANIFVVDLVGFSMLREFAPLITALIGSPTMSTGDIIGMATGGYAYETDLKPQLIRSISVSSRFSMGGRLMAHMRSSR
jgi:hypothetical protein